MTFNANPAFRDTVYHITLKAYNGCDTSYFRDSVKVFADSKAVLLDTTGVFALYPAYPEHVNG